MKNTFTGGWNRFNTLSDDIGVYIYMFKRIHI